MKVLMKLKNLQQSHIHGEACRCKICRNLHRIMDIKVIKIDPEKQTISFIYENPKALPMVIDELRRIGCPVKYIIKMTKGKLYRRIAEHQAAQPPLIDSDNYQLLNSIT